MKLLNEMTKDKSFLRRIIYISIPIILQSLLNNMLNFVDTLMIGQLGKTSVSAVGLANKVFFVLSLLIFGVCSGSAVLSSQYWGKRDMKNIKKVLGMSLLIGVFGASIIFGLSFFQPHFVMSIFTNDENIIEVGVIFLRVVCLSFILSAITQVFMASLRSINEVKIPVVISVIAILVNILLNYTLIFGNFGFKAYGVAGAATATVIARLIECLSTLCFVYLKKTPIAASLSEMFHFDKTFISKYVSTVSPVIANEFMWGLGVTIYSLAYGRMGEDAVAAITVTQSFEQMMQVVFMGLSNAAAIILGNELGAGKLKEAKEHAKYFLILQGFATFLMIIAGFLFKKPIIQLFGMDQEVNRLINQCFIVFLIFMVFKVFNTMNIVGILRSGGDTKAALLIDITGVWFIGIPMAFLGGIALDLPIYMVYAMVMLEEVYKMIVGVPRYLKRKWLCNIVAE